jgi:vancomycin resistance protein YoaR
VAQGILEGSNGPFELTPKRADDPVTRSWASGSMIVELIGEFTTNHPCCEARVTNIQRMADLIRGVYILPGETFSVNEFVGPRTRDNGFVSAGAIRQGHMVQEVGGGVSQFVTTTFNAAYFAGLDFDEYRSHTIYFSRYPYGREATIGIPYPDLILNNTTDYPILVWNSYSGTSITVSLYSTKSIDVEELGQRRSSAGACTHVETDRQRTYPDGSVVVDTVVADYRPGEGLDCSGRAIPRPNT